MKTIRANSRILLRLFKAGAVVGSSWRELIVKWVPGRVGFLGFKSLIRLLVDDAFLGRPMLPRSQIDYAGMPMMCSTGKTMAIGGIMDGCSIAIVVRGYGRQIVVTIIKKKLQTAASPKYQRRNS